MNIPIKQLGNMNNWNTNELQDLLPNLDTYYLQPLVEILKFANTLGSNMWGCYQTKHKNKIRVTFGNKIIATLNPSGLWLALDVDTLDKNEIDRQGLEDSKTWTWDSSDPSTPDHSYKQPRSRNGYYLPVADLELWTILKQYHFSYIEKVAASSSQLKLPSQKTHDATVVYMFREILNDFSIPEPHYSHDSDEDDDTEEIDQIEELKKIEESDLSATEKESLTKSRVGQGQFRDELIKYWGRCSVTGIEIKRLLIASHIQPWKDSTNFERLDHYNGLLLQPNLDKLFDKFLISFDNSGHILLSSLLSDLTYEKLGVSKDMCLTKIDPNHLKYLKYHRERFVKKQMNSD